MELRSYKVLDPLILSILPFFLERRGYKMRPLLCTSRCYSNNNWIKNEINNLKSCNQSKLLKALNSNFYYHFYFIDGSTLSGNLVMNKVKIILKPLYLELFLKRFQHLFFFSILKLSTRVMISLLISISRKSQLYCRRFSNIFTVQHINH